MSKTKDYTPRLLRQLTTVMTTAKPASKDESWEIAERIRKNKLSSEKLLALLILKYAGYKNYCRIIDVVMLRNDLKENADNSKNVGTIVYSEYDEDAERYSREIVIDGTLTLVVVEKMFGTDAQVKNSAIVDPARLSQISHELSEVGYKKKIVSAVISLEPSHQNEPICKGAILRSYCVGESRVDAVYLRYDLALGCKVIVYANTGVSDECK